jgi:hypothetical protein
MPLSRGLATDQNEGFFYYFDIFVQRNSFTGRREDFRGDLVDMVGTVKGGYLADAMLAIGAMGMGKGSSGSSSARRGYSAAALGLYARSLRGLKQDIECGQDPSVTSILWTTLFLGLFEVRFPPSPPGIRIPSVDVVRLHP